jgi:hypothetical protein
MYNICNSAEARAASLLLTAVLTLRSRILMGTSQEETGAERRESFGLRAAGAARAAPVTSKKLVERQVGYGLVAVSARCGSVGSGTHGIKLRLQRL